MKTLVIYDIVEDKVRNKIFEAFGTEKDDVQNGNRQA